MPVVMIEVRRDYAQAEEVALLDAVHAAMVDALKIPVDDKIMRLQAHAPHRFACPPGLAQPDRYTLVSIDLFSGRSLDAKRRLYAGIVARLAPLGIPADHVQVRLREIAPENWGLGGRAGSDIDLGFKIDV